jgi:hypothetical protein
MQGSGELDMKPASARSRALAGIFVHIKADRSGGILFHTVLAKRVSEGPERRWFLDRGCAVISSGGRSCAAGRHM